MLKLMAVSGERPYSIEVGEYVPLQIEFEPQVLSVDEAYYWRSTNFNFLLEVKIHAGNGAVAEVAAVLVPQDRIVKTDRSQMLHKIAERETGLPHFDTASWTNEIGQREIGIDPVMRRHDEVRPYRILVDSTGLLIIFDGGSPKRMVRNGTISFLFDSENMLCGVGVENDRIAKDAARKHALK